MAILVRGNHIKGISLHYKVGTLTGSLFPNAIINIPLPFFHICNLTLSWKSHHRPIDRKKVERKKNVEY